MFVLGLKFYSAYQSFQTKILTVLVKLNRSFIIQLNLRLLKNRVKTLAFLVFALSRPRSLDFSRSSFCAPCFFALVRLYIYIYIPVLFCCPVLKVYMYVLYIYVDHYVLYICIHILYVCIYLYIYMYMQQGEDRTARKQRPNWTDRPRQVEQDKQNRIG